MRQITFLAAVAFAFLSTANAEENCDLYTDDCNTTCIDYKNIMNIKASEYTGDQAQTASDFKACKTKAKECTEAKNKWDGYIADAMAACNRLGKISWDCSGDSEDVHCTSNQKTAKISAEKRVWSGGRDQCQEEVDNCGKRGDLKPNEDKLFSSLELEVPEENSKPSLCKAIDDQNMANFAAQDIKDEEKKKEKSKDEIKDLQDKLKENQKQQADAKAAVAKADEDYQKDFNQYLTNSDTIRNTGADTLNKMKAEKTKLAADINNLQTTENSKILKEWQDETNAADKVCYDQAMDEIKRIQKNEADLQKKGADFLPIGELMIRQQKNKYNIYGDQYTQIYNLCVASSSNLAMRRAADQNRAIALQALQTALNKANADMVQINNDINTEIQKEGAQASRAQRDIQLSMQHDQTEHDKQSQELQRLSGEAMKLQQQINSAQADQTKLDQIYNDNLKKEQELKDRGYKGDPDSSAKESQYAKTFEDLKDKINSNITKAGQVEFTSCPGGEAPAGYQPPSFDSSGGGSTKGTK